MVTLKINGQKHTINVEEDMPLLWAIRDIIGLTGTKYGCGKGLCGACTVLLNDSPVQSCVIPVSAAIDKSILTIEGTDKNLQKLQEAWILDNVAQCGFCQPGQIISATALLNKTPNPSEKEINEAMQGNICRCGTYTRIKEAIQKTVESNQ